MEGFLFSDLLKMKVLLFLYNGYSPVLFFQLSVHNFSYNNCTQAHLIFAKCYQ